MAQLRQDYQQFVERDTEVIAVGREERETFARYWEKEQMPFPGLPDPTHTAADLYGQEVNLIKLGRMPARACAAKARGARGVSPRPSPFPNLLGLAPNRYASPGPDDH